MRQKSENVLSMSQLQLMDTGSCIFKFIENDQEKWGVFKELNQEYPELLARMSVVDSQYNRILQGKQAVEERLVFNDDDVLVGTFSIYPERVYSYHSAEDYEQQVISFMEEVDDWFLVDDEDKRFHIDFERDVKWYMYWFPTSAKKSSSVGLNSLKGLGLFKANDTHATPTLHESLSQQDTVPDDLVATDLFNCDI